MGFKDKDWEPDEGRGRENWTREVGKIEDVNEKKTMTGPDQSLVQGRKK